MRLADAVLDDCLCDPAAPLSRDPACCYGLDKAQAQAQLASLKEWLRVQQTMLWANRRDALLLVLQGPDCSGKNGVIRRVLGGLDPLGLSPHSFQAPSENERRHDFLWRYRERLPVAGIHPLKCYLQLSAGEQKQRLHRRLEQPEKRWKLTLGDLRDHRNFAQQQALWADVLSKSHSREAPWHVIPADRRWLRDLLVASLLAREFERLALDWPTRPAPFTHADLDSTP